MHLNPNFRESGLNTYTHMNLNKQNTRELLLLKSCDMVNKMAIISVNIKKSELKIKDKGYRDRNAKNISNYQPLFLIINTPIG